MSFQGDVGGIGLADLLQSLARGRDGVLSLLGKDGSKSTVGFSGGMLHLLPETDEDPEIWRNRARQSWIKDPDFRIDALRMEEIARACRLELLYQHLDSESLHFRFVPGAIPEPVNGSAISSEETGLGRSGVRRDAVFVAPTGVENLLLEYMRLKDELASSGLQDGVDVDLVVLPNGPHPDRRETRRFYEECDGVSSLREIADRLGMPLRQAGIHVWNELKSAALRAATPDELLLMAQNELGNGYCERAASRLRSWWLWAPCGPLPELDARALDGEWKAGRLSVALRAMPAAAARTILRRLERTLSEPVAAPARWFELARRHGGDRIAIVRMVHWQVRTSADPNVPTVKDLMAMSRAFLDEGRHNFARAFLRIAAARAPDSSVVRLELGLYLLEAGLPELASPFVLEAAREFLDRKAVEKAIPPLRALCAALPQNREARRLYALARAQGVGRTLAKRNSLIGLSIVAALIVGATVQFRSQRSFNDRLEHVYARVSEPRLALQVLELEFAGDESGRIAELRAQLTQAIEHDDHAARSQWMDRYKEAQLECTLGDALVGLRRTLALKPPPRLSNAQAAWPLVDDLFSTLISRLDAQHKLLGETIFDTPLQVRSEEKLLAHLSELESALQGTEVLPEAVKTFQAKLEELEASIQARADRRAEARHKLAAHAALEHMDQLLASARAHDAARDYEHSLAAYARLLEVDESQRLGKLLQAEISGVKARRDAVRAARELAARGEHEQAHELLIKAINLEGANEVALAWRVTSIPAGARARLSDGTERVTPFTLSTAWSESVDLRLELEGHETVNLTCPHPGNRAIYLSRIFERAWSPPGRIDTTPISVGDDHVIADRTGKIVRLGRKSDIVWSQSVESLGGFARSPVFLPKRPGHLLCVTEEGDVWIVEVATGALEGPWAAGSAPVNGPILGDDGVRVSFRDGKSFAWSSRLKPDPIDSSTAAHVPAAGNSGRDGGLAVLRRSDARATLPSPWTGITVEVQDAAYLIKESNGTELRFSVRRTGEWSYVAWESPTTLIPRGRLWIADGSGLRSFVP